MSRRSRDELTASERRLILSTSETKPEWCSDARWKIELARRKNPYSDYADSPEAYPFPTLKH